MRKVFRLLLLLLLLPEVSWAFDPAAEICPIVQRRSWGQIHCEYQPETPQWLLTYRSAATYKLVMRSGRHQELLRSLCRARPDPIREERPGNWSRVYFCAPPSAQ